MSFLWEFLTESSDPLQREEIDLSSPSTANANLPKLVQAPDFEYYLHKIILVNSTKRRRLYLIGHFHDGVILLQLPEFISFSFSNSNFVIPVESKEQ